MKKIELKNININLKEFILSNKIKLVAFTTIGVTFLSCFAYSKTKEPLKTEIIYSDDCFESFTNDNMKMQCILLKTDDYEKFLFGFFNQKDNKLYIKEIFKENFEYDVENLYNSSNNLEIFICDAISILPASSISNGKIFKSEYDMRISRISIYENTIEQKVIFKYYVGNSSIYSTAHKIMLNDDVNSIIDKLTIKKEKIKVKS